jgi:SAM-dependent methyltransferase
VHNWDSFRSEHDLLEASHRGLQRELIPVWFREARGPGAGISFSDRIDASAYGETPPYVVEALLDIMQPGPEELFVDLGCGAGNVCAAVLARGARALGIERNPELARAARAFMAEAPAERWELREADFLETDWSAAHLAYATTLRFPPAVLQAVAERAEASPHLRAIAGLGRRLPLSWPEQDLGYRFVRWNPGEDYRTEQLYLYSRPLPRHLAKPP